MVAADDDLMTVCGEQGHLPAGDLDALLSCCREHLLLLWRDGEHQLQPLGVTRSDDPPGVGAERVAAVGLAERGRRCAVDVDADVGRRCPRGFADVLQPLSVGLGPATSTGFFRSR